MSRPHDHVIAALGQVLVAAEALLEARANQMITSVEWTALEIAVAAAQPKPSPTAPQSDRRETFTIREDILARSVTPARGAPYQHTCDKDVYEQVALAIDGLVGASFTYEEIRQMVQAPFTQVATAIAFLKERGSIVPTQRRRIVAASADDTYLDAMIEWHRLIEQSALGNAPGTSAG